MSGVEPAVVAGGGRLLGGLAAPAARALARKLSFRWIVWWQVRKRVDFRCRWRTYRKWLKTITAEELATPVEDIHGPLAKRLDDTLTRASKDWASSDDHLSRALRLVEVTYPAVAAALRDTERVELTESWAQRRSVDVRDRLLQLAGPGAAMGSADLAMVLHRRSEARRAVRLQVFEVDEAALASYFAQVELPDISAGGVVVLLGDFGAGKSEIAEAWHRVGIKNLTAGEDAPFPVWLSARDLLGQRLEDAVDRQLGPAWRYGRGASIAVDGLDETDPATAQTLLDAVRIIARAQSNVRVLLTARPGVLSPTSTEEATAALLTEEDALKLVELAGGKSRDTWRWTADMRATVTRPFFALAAGAMLRRDEAARGEADLIRGLVENALKKGTERLAVTSSETRSILENLAVALTRTGRDGLSFSHRQIARSSRLVADNADGSVRFCLPIFQHWFAAQAILAGDVPAVEVVADARSFNRWRWAAAVAALSATGARQVDDLLGTWVTGNPGAAAWVINAAFSEHRQWRTEGSDDLDVTTSGSRLLQALRIWANALGPFADRVLPYRLVRGPVGLGVIVRGHWIDVAISTSQPTADHVIEVPPEVLPLRPDAVPDWQPWFGGAPPEGDAWPWIMVRDRIAKETLNKLYRDPFLGAPDGVWVEERRFDLARRLLSLGSAFHGDLPADRVRVRAADIFEQMGRDRQAGIVLDGDTIYSGGELDDLVSWIDANTVGQIVWHLPKEDVPPPEGGLIWHLYSPQRLMEFEAEVYGRACDAYDEAMAHSFAPLGWSMPDSAFAPFGVILEVDFTPGRLGDIPGLTAIRVPMELLPSIAPTGPEATWSVSRRAVITRRRESSTDWDRYNATLETVRSWLAEHHRELLGGLGWGSSVAEDMSKARPACSVAGRWLWKDLQSVGLGKGTLLEVQ
ncbi:hypothetical protein [Kribbella sp. NPDC023855]|uniref:NACHT domain-containing protein n=1 Tax=Kribbella sp. NPDC023855 TaxID=3154698 RepID=UPI0033FD2BEF